MTLKSSRFVQVLIVGLLLGLLSIQTSHSFLFGSAAKSASGEVRETPVLSEEDTTAFMTIGSTKNPMYSTLLEREGTKLKRYIDDGDDSYNNARTKLFVNTKQKKVYVNFLATEETSFNDWMTNFKCSRKNLVLIDYVSSRTLRYPKKFDVHTGFYNEYSLHSYKIFEFVDEYLKKGYSLVFTGHSQGGGIGTIAFIHFNVMYGNYRNRIKLVTMGSPRALSKELAKYVEKHVIDKNNIRRYETVILDNKSLKSDLVTNLPFIFQGYKHIGNEILVKCKHLTSFSKCHKSSGYLGSVELR